MHSVGLTVAQQGWERARGRCGLKRLIVTITITKLRFSHFVSGRSNDAEVEARLLQPEREFWL
jgi:hypothetical protein